MKTDARTKMFATLGWFVVPLKINNPPCYPIVPCDYIILFDAELEEKWRKELHDRIRGQI